MEKPLFIIHSDGTIEQVIEYCEDTISRKASIEAMKKLFNQDCKDYGCEIPECFDADRAIKELKDLPPVQPKLSESEDCISRQAVLKLQYRIDDSATLSTRDVVNVEDIEDLSSVTPKPKIGHCKDCKWWRDSDGVYRRGINAESQCPINGSQVFEGNGYCYMFKLKEKGLGN